MMAQEDMNMGEEVTHAIHSIYDETGSQQKYDKERCRSLSRFVNSQMDRILVSKLN